MTIVRYQYKDPKEMSGFQVIQEGEGYFKILGIENKISKSGNEMLVVSCKLRDNANNATLYNHYLLYNEYMAENMWRICESVGKPEAYKESGTNTDDLLGCAGRCKIKTENDNYGERSKIHRFIPHQSVSIQQTSVQITQEPSDDEIPF